MNRYRPSLRWRVTIAFTVLGAVLSVLFAAAAVLITEHYEHVLVDEILHGQAEDYSLRMVTDPNVALPRTHRLSGYLRRPDGSGEVPEDLRALEPGIHESEEDGEGEEAEEGEGIHFGVFDTSHGRLYFVIDLSDIEQLEVLLTQFLAAIVVLGTALSGWLGWLLAGATIAPVRRLAQAVEALPVQPQRTELASSMGLDELGRLALAIDAYQARLADADATEREFFADASHELRTPVTVVCGAVELLLEEPAADAGLRRRLQRLDRGVRELTELLDVLLGLVRKRAPEIAEVDMNSMLRVCAQAVTDGSGPERLWVDIEADGALQIPYREALLILHGIIRRLLPPDPAGRLSLRARRSMLELEFRADVDVCVGNEPETGARSDRRLGLTLIGRLAERLGWQIDEVVTDPLRRMVRITLPPPPDV